ncbi:putative translation initiation factor eIF-2B subunit epsilon [Rosellinia necatrix]|uniref:Translation initiation factor eIF2B subunit epsilon n=1 Tax=Rosellinia necatrix TaxID=77044 RepID=A0A1W2TQJ0_ROSNE|nr:putative translation initiation factor eIF-2B subunit epsilon [Rosellinia necatrix]
MSQSKGGRGGAAAKGKKPGKPGADEKREDALQAVVIADDFQPRFLPFSLDKPRCLLPLANTPLIEYTLEFLAMNDVQEVYIYCGAHHEQIERYIHNSRWSPIARSCPFSTLEFIRVADARSAGDFLRDLDKRNIIGGDFVLVHGDLVSNLSLEGALAAHKARREANRDSCMTMVLREAGEREHRTKPKTITPVFIVDPRKNRCLHYEEINPFQADRYVDLDPAVLENAEAEVRTDVIDPQIDICTPDVLALWSESFDYEVPRANFLHGVLKDWELNGKMIHTEIVTEGYGARATNLQMYDAISQDMLAGWTYPFTPDCNLLKGQSYRLRDGNVYQEDDVFAEDDTEPFNSVLARDTHIGSKSVIQNCIIGRNCRIGSNVRIANSFIWDDVEIGDDAVIEHAIVADAVHIGKGAAIHEGSLVSYGVRIGEKSEIEASTVLSLLTCNRDYLPSQAQIVGEQGKGAVFQYEEEDDSGAAALARLENSLLYNLDQLDIDASSVSTLDEDGLSDDGSEAPSATPSQPTGRSRLSSFASDDSGTPNFSSFHADAVHGLLEVLRGSVGDFDSEKLEFTSLRLANNASDVAMRKAVATAFVRRAVELMNVDSSGLDAAKAAKEALTSRAGASAFVADVGVGGDSISEQVEFALAVQRACVSSARIIETGKAGNLLAAMLQQMYDLDVLEEEGLIAWWGDARGKEGEVMPVIRAKCQALIEWLENAEEESDDDDDDDDD